MLISNLVSFVIFYSILTYHLRRKNLQSSVKMSHHVKSIVHAQQKFLWYVRRPAEAFHALLLVPQSCAHWSKKPPPHSAYLVAEVVTLSGPKSYSLESIRQNVYNSSSNGSLDTVRAKDFVLCLCRSFVPYRQVLTSQIGKLSSQGSRSGFTGDTPCAA